jgi:hypothetical protein
MMMGTTGLLLRAKDPRGRWRKTFISSLLHRGGWGLWRLFLVVCGCGLGLPPYNLLVPPSSVVPFLALCV